MIFFNVKKKTDLSFLLFFLIITNYKSQVLQVNGRNYEPVSVWYDGSQMTDAKLDDKIYIKQNSKFYKLNYEGNLIGSFFGTNSYDNQDDSDAIQKAINYAIKTSQNIVFPSGTYFVSKTIIIPQHFHYSMKPIKIDFSNANLVVSNDITVFQSDNWDSKSDSKMSNGIVFGNFQIDFKNQQNNSYAIKLQDYHQGSKLENISANNVKNLLYSRNNFYLELYNINSNYNGSAGIRFLFEGYHGLNKFSKLTAGNSEKCYSFQGGMIAAIEMHNISIEGCKIGIDFGSEVYSFSLRNSYIENFKTALVFRNYIHSATIESTYVNFLSEKDAYLVDYKGLPANNLVFKRNNSYVGTSDFGNLIKGKENIYGKGIVFEIPNIDETTLKSIKSKVGQNIKIEN